MDNGKQRRLEISQPCIAKFNTSLSTIAIEYGPLGTCVSLDLCARRNRLRRKEEEPSEQSKGKPGSKTIKANRDRSQE